MAEYWLGDTHFGHEKVSKLRGFETTDEHDDLIIHQIKSSLRKGDRLWILGDISGGRSEEEQRAIEIFEELRKELAIEIHLIAGNHDAVSSIHKNGFKHQDRFRIGFNSIQAHGRFNGHGETVLMSHFPYAAMGDGDERATVRYLEWRLQDTGLPLLHAHTHQNAPHARANDKNITRIEEDGLDYNSMCVSWDSRRGLTSEKDINEWIIARKRIKNSENNSKLTNFYSKILNAPR